MVNVTSPREIVRLLSENNLSPLKKFGQNFLCDGNIVDKIADSIGLTKSDYVLEIGAGLGALTRALCLRGKKVVSIEIDAGLLKLHEKTLADCANVTVLEGDILKCDLSEICREYFGGAAFHVCGNLPYYITSKILMMLLESDAPVLSVTGSAVCDVPREDYVKIVRAAFSMRRKTLLNNLKQFGGADAVIAVLKNCNIDPKTRAQNLSPVQFCSLAKEFFQK